MNDEFRTGIKRLRDVYNYLTEEEPSPDEEEESQREMIILLESLIMHIPPENIEENLELFKNTLTMTKEWDTLEFWFKEKPELVTNFKLILNRFLIRHAEPEPIQESKYPLQTGRRDDLSEQLAAALERAMKNLPPDADVTKIIQSVTSQVTENYVNKTRSEQSESKQGESLGEKAEASAGILQSPQSTIKHNHTEETMMSTAARVKIRKEDIMKSVLEQVKNKIDQATEPTPAHKLVTPKIVIPKVTKPKEKIIPYMEQVQEKSIVEEKERHLQEIPLLEPQDKPKEPPKLKVGAFKKDIKLTTPATPEIQEPIRPKIIVKPKIITKVEEMPMQIEQSEPVHIPENSSPQSPPVLLKTPKIQLRASTVPKKNQQEIKEDPKVSPLKLNVLRPSEPSVKDTQINLFETFSKQEKSQKTRKEKKKSDTTEETDSKSPESQTMEEIEFPEHSIPYEKMDKTQLYQELIALEGKKYAIEKSRNEFRGKHEKGLISDGNYAAQLDRFKYDLQYLSKKINEIRQRIQTM